MKVNDFINSMAEAGFEFTFKAQSKDMTVIGESIMSDSGQCVITKRKVRSADASREIIRQMFKKPIPYKQTKAVVNLVNEYAKRKG